MSRYDVCMPEPQECKVPEPEPQQCVAPPTSNAAKQEEMGSSGGGKGGSTSGSSRSNPSYSPPSAKLDFGETPVIKKILPSPNATIYAEASLGGSLTAKSVGSRNPGTVSNKDVSVGNDNGQVSAGADGGISTEVSSTLNGIKSSMGLSLDSSGIPTISYGVAGSFGSVKTGVSGNTFTFTCSPKDIKKVVNGVELTGSISFTVKLTVIPHPKFKPKPWYQQIWDGIANGLESVGDFIWDNKEVILVGTAVVAIGAAVVMTGGAAAPALVAVPSDRRLKKDIRLVGHSPSGIPMYHFRYRHSDVLYHGVMAQDLTENHPHALVMGEDGFYRVRYDCIDVDCYALVEQ